MSKTSNMCVAQKMRKVREKADLSQEEVAAYLGIGQQGYSRYEKGLSGISTRNLIKFCELLQVPIEEFLVLYESEEVPCP